jgi:hypothetical protein
MSIRTGWALARTTLTLVLAATACTTDRRADSIQPPDAEATDGADVFSELRRREPQLPRPGSAPCSSGAVDPGDVAGAIHLPGIPSEAGLGPGTTVEELARGPVYFVFQAIPRALDLFPPTSRGRRVATVLIVSRPSYRGPVLVRGRGMDGPERIGFALGPELHWELRLPDGSWDDRETPLRVWGRKAHLRPGWRVAVAHLLVPKGRCSALQVDGSSFSYALVFFTIWQ